MVRSFLMHFATVVALIASLNPVSAQPVAERYWLMSLDAPELASYERAAIRRACKPDVPRFIRQETYVMRGLKFITVATDLRCVPREGFYIVAINCDHVSRRRCTVENIDQFSMHFELVMRLPHLEGFDRVTP